MTIDPFMVSSSRAIIRFQDIEKTFSSKLIVFFIRNRLKLITSISKNDAYTIHLFFIDVLSEEEVSLISNQLKIIKSDTHIL